MERADDVRAAAEDLASRAEIGTLLGRLSDDAELRGRAEADGAAFLADQGIDVPEGLGIRFGEKLRPDIGHPVPDWEPFSIRLTRCRTFVVRDPGKPPYTETVCFGIEIVRNPVPGGPRG